MSLVISGSAANASTSLASSIIGMANNGSGAIRVQTGAPHHYATGDYVHIETFTTVIDSYFTITVIDATHFDLDGSTYTGTGTGTATDRSLTPAFQVPTDGDTASLQLSGLLSALQCLANRQQALAKDLVQQTLSATSLSASNNVTIPPWATQVIIFGCGGGGGGGGGIGGAGAADFQYAAGGGGAGAELGVTISPLFNATSLDVTIGAGGTAGVGSAGNAGGTPLKAGTGGRGGSTIVTCHDGAFPGLAIGTFRGGESGGGGGNEVLANVSTIPVYTPGGTRGPANFFRNGQASKTSRYAPGPAQFYDLINSGGAISAASSWDVRVYTDPVGQMNYGDGGASMAVAQHSLYAAGVSYAGAPSVNGYAGGAAGALGTPDGAWNGGAPGGGGGGGPFGAGGVGGSGGAGSSAAGATSGTAGASPGHTGSGGGGGGGGGNGSSVAGNGRAGGSGGAGIVWLVFISAAG